MTSKTARPADCGCGCLRAAVLTPLGPAPVIPDRDLVSSWSARSMTDYMTAQARAGLHEAAERARELEHRGAPHFKVVMPLAAAEMVAARIGADELALHSARLDAYSNAHGLRGWYRCTDLRGKHAVQVNYLRTIADGNVDRYYTHRLTTFRPDPEPFWVIDRDTGRTVATCATAKAANAWIEAAGGFAARPAATPDATDGTL